MSAGVLRCYLIQRANVVPVPEDGCFFTEPAVCAQDHTAMGPGTLGLQIIRYKESVRHRYNPPRYTPSFSLCRTLLAHILAS